MNSWRHILSWDTRAGEDPLLGMLCKYDSRPDLYVVIVGINVSKYDPQQAPRYWGWFTYSEAAAIANFELLKQSPDKAKPVSEFGVLCVARADGLTPYRFIGMLPFEPDLSKG